jgi:phage baseplate assembly protein W
MSGIDRQTGQPLSGWAHVMQSVDVIFETEIGERVMLRHFGGGLQAVLGRRITPAVLARATVIFALAIALWEPRLRVVRASVAASAEEVRAGEIAFVLDVAYRPRGHLGDLTEESALRRIGLGAGIGGVFGTREIVA